MASAPTIVEEVPMLTRLDRLDNILKQLEEIRGGSNVERSSAKSSCASTANSSGTLTSDGQPTSSVDFSPRSLEKHCRPIDDVMMETELKGNVLERLAHLEDRVLNLCLELEKELLEIQDQKDHSRELSHEMTPEKKGKKKGLKQLVKSYVRSSGKHKSKRSDHNV